MCSPVRCSSCGKTTWAGCGQHVDQVKASVPASQWCTCDRNAPARTATAPAAGGLSSFFRR